MVDSIEEFVASIEVDGREMARVPQWLLPEDAKEGDVLRVTHERSKGRSSLRVEIDAEATQTARAASARQVTQQGTRKDPGGNITL